MKALATALALGLAPKAAAAPAAASPEQLFQAAQRSYEARDYLAALGGFVELLEKHPRNAFEDRAKVLLGKSIQAIDAADRSRVLPEADYGKAVEEARRAQARQREDGRRLLESLERLSDRLSKAGDPLPALRGEWVDLGGGVEGELESLKAARYLEVIRDKLQRKIAAGGSSEAEFHEALGFLWLYRGELGKAAAEWTEALKLDPLNKSLTQDLERARARLKEENRQKEAQGLYSLARRQAEAGFYEDASKSLARLAGLDPAREDARALLKSVREGLARQERESRVEEKRQSAQSLWRSGAWDSAVLAWLEVLKLEPSDEEARLYIVRYQEKVRRKGDPAPAARARPAEGTRDPEKAQQAYTLGLVYYAQGETAKARTAFQSALALDPGLEKARRGLEQLDQERSPDL